MADTTILLVEDEHAIVNYITTVLETQSYRVVSSTRGKEGLSLAASHSPDLVLLDLGLPDMDGVDFLRSLRSWSGLPVIVVTARGQERDQIEALDAGADDYLVKPFRVGELLARTRAALRRASRPAAEATPVDAQRYRFGPLLVDVERRRVLVNGTEIHLTPIEYRILLAFLKHPGRVLTHSFLQSQVWGHINPDQDANLRVFVSSLRRKIQPKTSDTPLIRTETGVGYRFSELESSDDDPVR